MGNRLHKDVARARAEERRSEFDAHLKERFKAVMIVCPKTKTELAMEMDVSVDLLRHFIDGGRKTHFKSLCKIEAWVIRYEKLWLGMHA